MICPRCYGEKQELVYACPGFRPMLVDCEVCGGTGEVGADYEDRAARGKACKQRRMEPHYRDMRALSRLTGLNVVTISKMERGVLDPAPLEAALDKLAAGGQT